MKQKSVLQTLTGEQIAAKLEAAGIQPTAQRLAIGRFVLGEASHPTAEQVKEWADRNFPKISLATVYNTLKSLVQAGLLKEVKLPHSESVIYDQHLEDHYHFLDESTGEVIDIPADQVEVVTKLKKKFHVKGVQVLLRGVLK